MFTAGNEKNSQYVLRGSLEEIKSFLGKHQRKIKQSFLKDQARRVSTPNKINLLGIKTTFPGVKSTEGTL